MLSCAFSLHHSKDMNDVARLLRRVDSMVQPYFAAFSQTVQRLYMYSTSYLKDTLMWLVLLVSKTTLRISIHIFPVPSAVTTWKNLLTADVSGVRGWADNIVFCFIFKGACWSALGRLSTRSDRRVSVQGGWLWLGTDACHSMFKKTSTWFKVNKCVKLWLLFKL